MSAPRKFDVEVVKAWRARVIAGESYESVAPSDVSGSQVYYHVGKLGPLPSLAERRGSFGRKRVVELSQRFGKAEMPPSDLLAPSLAARMAGRARIPRKIERLEGVEA